MATRMEEKKTQWHPAFCSAMKLELIENRGELEFRSEHGINTKPILIDLLVIRKSPEASIHNEIGRIFRGHNIFEYKSPDDSLNLDTFFKAVAYASLYKASAGKVDGIRADDITISLVRKRKPEGLMRELEKAGMKIGKAGEGIYYVDCSFFFKIQIIVSKELDKEEHLWLTSLTDDLTKEQGKRLIIESAGFKEKEAREYADSVMQVALKENSRVFRELKNQEVAENMCEALRELMKDEITKELSKEREEGREEGIAKGRENEIFLSVQEGDYGTARGAEKLK